MSLDDLKSNWLEMKHRFDTSEIDAIAHRVTSKMGKFDHSIRRRDTLENLAAIFVLLFFAAICVYSKELITRVGAAIVVVGAVEIIAVLNVARIYRPTEAGLPLVDHCISEISRVDRQIFLLRNVSWWYVGPLMLGCCVMAFADGPWFVSVTSCLFFIAVGYWIHRINQKAVVTQLVPLRQDLTAAIESFNANLTNKKLGEDS